MIIEPDSWLSLSNDGGKIGINNSIGSTIDRAIFSPDMHFSLLKNTSGVSLERKAVNRSGIDSKNWHSASTRVNYATPGEENSQIQIEEEQLSAISISPKEFSPDNDGVDDFLTIHYNFSQGGFVASVKIYNQRGGQVKDLVNNELCGFSGSFFWDGLDENGGRLGMGYYIILIEAWNSDGQYDNREKDVFVITPKKIARRSI